VSLTCTVGDIAELLPHWLGLFDAPMIPAGMAIARGSVEPFSQEKVVRSVSPNAIACYHPEQQLDLYRDAERYWLVDDRWGICQLNLLQRTWTSWVIEQPRMDPVRVLEWSVLWPMAQVLRGKGLSLVPAAGVAREGSGLLLISTVNVGRQMQSLIRGGWNLIGQRWVALREEEGRVAMLQMPGAIELVETWRQSPFRRSAPYTDLLEAHPAAGQHHAFCDAVVLIGPGRRGGAGAHRLQGDDALGELRRRWPIAELHPARAQGIAHRLYETCDIHTLHLPAWPADATAGTLSAIIGAVRNKELP
jgi:hypothetical protein